MTRAEFMLLGVVLVAVATPSLAGAMGQRTPLEQVDCRIIEEAARANLIPAGLLTHLLWTESRFQADAVSPKGALGVAQFMPETADERWLSDPLIRTWRSPNLPVFLPILNDNLVIPGWRSRRTMQAVSA
jgi:hypothetical protein